MASSHPQLPEGELKIIESAGRVIQSRINVITGLAQARLNVLTELQEDVCRCHRCQVQWRNERAQALDDIDYWLAPEKKWD